MFDYLDGIWLSTTTFMFSKCDDIPILYYEMGNLYHQIFIHFCEQVYAIWANGNECSGKVTGPHPSISNISCTE